jgi:hypothetical protein
LTSLRIEADAVGSADESVGTLLPPTVPSSRDELTFQCLDADLPKLSDVHHLILLVEERRLRFGQGIELF